MVDDNAMVSEEQSLTIEPVAENFRVASRMSSLAAGLIFAMLLAWAMAETINSRCERFLDTSLVDCTQ